jgi:hypothetical protein
VTVEIRRTWPSADIAARIAKVVAVDNPEYVEVRAQGAELIVRVRSTSAASARASVDDLLACLHVAEATVAVTQQR